MIHIFFLLSNFRPNNLHYQELISWRKTHYYIHLKETSFTWTINIIYQHRRKEKSICKQDYDSARTVTQKSQWETGSSESISTRVDDRQTFFTLSFTITARSPKSVTAFDLFTFFRADLIQSQASWKLSSASDWLIPSWKNVN